MKIEAHRLKHALSLVGPAISKRTALPITTNFLVDQGRIIGTNLDMFISAELPEAQGERFCLPYQIVNRFLQHVPNMEILEITTDGLQTVITAGGLRTTLGGSDPEYFPPFPRIESPMKWSVNGDRWLNGLTGVANCAADDDSRPVLEGVHLTFGDPIEVAAADGFRLAWQALSVKMEAPDLEGFTIPKSAMERLKKVWDTAIKVPATVNPQGFQALSDQPLLEAVGTAIAPRMLHIEYGAEQTRLIASMGEVKVSIELLSGDFPRYTELIPAESNHQLTFDAADAYRAARMVSTFAEQSSNILRLEWDEEKLTLSARCEDLGEISQVIPANVKGGGDQIALNCRYLLEYLNGKQGMVLMETTQRTHPGLFSHESGPNVLIMPMFVQWEEVPPPEPGNNENESIPEEHQDEEVEE